MSRRALSLVCFALLAASLCGIATFSWVVQPSPNPPSRSTNGVPKLSIHGSYDPKYFTVTEQMKHSEAVIVGTVTKRLATQMNPVSGGWVDADTEVLPVPYRGYEVAVEQWFGGLQPAEAVRVFHMGGGEVVIQGRKTLVEVEYDPEINPGDRVLLPIVKSGPYGVPGGPNDHWLVSDGKGAFVIGDGIARRAAKLDGLLPAQVGGEHVYTLPELVEEATRLGLEERPIARQ